MNESQLLDFAIAEIALLHGDVIQPKKQGKNPKITIISLNRFVDAHAKLLFERKQNEILQSKKNRTSKRTK